MQPSARKPVTSPEECRVRKECVTTVKKADYEKAEERLEADIEQIKKDYTPRSVHDKAFDEVRGDITRKVWNYYDFAEGLSQKAVLI